MLEANKICNRTWDFLSNGVLPHQQDDPYNVLWTPWHDHVHDNVFPCDKLRFRMGSHANTKSYVA